MNTLSKLIRQTHMYLALVLTPWVLVYALSSLYMNHRDRSQRRVNDEAEAPKTVLILEREMTLPESVDNPREVLFAAGLDGPHWAENPKPDGSIAITRRDAFRPVHLTWFPAQHKVRIERETFHLGGFLMRLHTRLGYSGDYRITNFWAAAVDLTAATIVFWSVSGLWMWFEMKATRKWGAAMLLAGALLFAVFLVVL